MESLSTDLRVADPMFLKTLGFTATAIVAVMGLGAVLAGCLPAWRAPRVDPAAS